MRYSHLLTSIISGKWAIRPNDAFAQEAIVRSLFEKTYDPETYSKILSDSQPYTIMAGTGKIAKDRKSGLDSLPEESTAILSLNGSMLKYGTMCSYGTQEIASALLEAGNHPNVGSIVLSIDSGGGSVDAIAPLTGAIAAIRAKGKSVVASVDLCASAAYYVACHCNEIVAENNISSEIGSIGVMMSFMDYSKYYKNLGIERKAVYSKLSEYKNRPFELLLEGKEDEIISEELDPLAREFQQSVRTHRGNKLKEETAGILQGRMFYAETAKQVGLVDHVANFDFAVSRAQAIRSNNLVNQYINN
jgi:protease-4